MFSDGEYDPWSMSRGFKSSKRGSKQVIPPTSRYNLRSAPELDLYTSSSQVGINMAVAFHDRDDPEYLKAMEEELVKSRQAREEETKLLQTLMAKMDRMEKSQSSVPAAGVGRGILRTPLKSAPAPGGLDYKSPHSLSSRLSADAVDVAPSDVINGPLTSVLQQLSIAIDPTPQSSTKGLLLRPEYYVQHKDKGVPVKSLDHSKLSFKELMSGMGRVMIHLAKSGGEFMSYIEHFNYLVRQAAVSNFQDSAYVGYDRHVVDKFINGDTATFVAGDLLGVALHFHVGNLVNVQPPTARGRGRGFRRRGRQSSWWESERDKDQYMPPSPEGFPEDICYNFNYRTCHGRCSKSHICRLCRGPHRASSSQCASKK